jgi:radical SAM superfamily enzyme YgiQ (UPF0313 family)
MQAVTPRTDALDSSPFKLFGRYYHFGPSFEAVAGRIQSLAPDVVGIASLFTPYAEEALACAKRARAAAPDSVIVMGGSHPSGIPEAVLDHPAVDFAVRGEGEGALPTLVDALRRRRDPSMIPGVAGRARDGAIFNNPPRFQTRIERFPRPARELLDLDAYRFEERRMTQILSSRGCPFACAFCSAHLTSGRVFRPRRPEDVVNEMRDCRDRLGIDAFDFEDDNLTFDRERAARLMDRIIESFGEETLWLEAMNGISMRALDADLLLRMRRAGFRNLNVSPLSYQAALRSSMERPEAVEESLAVPGLAASLGFRVTAYLMIGYPGQTLREMMETLCRLAREPVLLAPSVFYPAPGARIHEELKGPIKHRWDIDWPMMRSSLFPEVPGGLKRRELRTVFWLTRLANFARSIDPDRRAGRLREQCSGYSALIAEKAAGPGKDQDLTSPRALDARERGLAALAAFLATKRPQGICIARRGGPGGDWTYKLFPLEEMIEDPGFYTLYGIPGFDAAGLWAGVG